MLPKSEKFALRHHPEFFQQAQKYTGTLLRVWYLPQVKTECSVIVSKKVSLSAVQRNALKRKCFTSLQELVLPTGAIVVTLFPSAITADQAQLKEALEQQLAKIK